MRGQPFVSVVIPAYNEEKWIASCIKSVLRDTYPHKEIIVVDDASTDGTSEILKQLPIKVIRNEKSVGPSSARNIGVKEAKGEIIVFIDAHCIVEDSNWIQRFLQFFQNPKIGAVGGYFKRKESKWGRPSKLGKSPPSPRRLVKSANGAYRKVVFEQVGGFDPLIEWGGDAALTYKVLRSGWKVVHSRDIMVIHAQKIWSIKRGFFYGTSYFPLLKKYPHERKLKTGIMSKGFLLSPMGIGPLLTLGLLADLLSRFPIFTLSIIVFFSIQRGWDYNVSLLHILGNGFYITIWDFAYYLGALYSLLRLRGRLFGNQTSQP